uniref:Envelope protein n=1 Tax=Catagonus wagneri TaxID=51154 RepID=A0A8C3WKU4_9CETA
MMALVFLYCLISLVSATSWKENTLVRLSQSVANGGNLSNCWICHMSPHAPHGGYLLSVVPITDFDTIPDPETFYNLSPPRFTFQVQIANRPQNTPTPCFHLSEVISIAGKITTGPPRSLKFLLSKCDAQNPSKCALNECVRTNSDSNLCQRVKQVGYHVNGLWEACSGSHPWLDNIISQLPKNEKINDTTLGGVTCAPPGFVFVCGIGSDSPTQGWAHRCLDSWQMEGSCLLGYFRTPFSVHSLQSLTSHSKSYSRLKREILARYEDKTGQGKLTPSDGIYINRDMIRNLSATIEQIAEDTAESILAPQTSLNSVTQVVLDNRMALDFLLAKEEGVCAVAHNKCCTYINAAGEVETQVNKVSEQATWL